MNPDIKCKRIVVNINKIEVCALDDLRISMRNSRKLARSAIAKVVDAWRATGAEESR